MSMSDPVSDMLTRIRNAQMSDKNEVDIPFSKLKAAILKILENEGYIKNIKVVDEGSKKKLCVALKYYNNIPVISTIQRVSRPGLRVYKSCNNLPKVMNGLGIAVVSTSQGVMTEKTAKAQRLGGELLCIVT